MGRFSAKQRIWKALTGLVSDTASTDRLLETLASVMAMRASLEEVQGAILHFAALPTRQDVRRLQRRVAALRRRVAELDLELARLERHRGPAQEAEGTFSSPLPPESA